jgi:hypothetical protein
MKLRRGGVGAHSLSSSAARADAPANTSRKTSESQPKRNNPFMGTLLAASAFRAPFSIAVI